MDYAITATIGPASNNRWMWQKMLAAGADAFRLNTSHLTLDQLDFWLTMLAEFFETDSCEVPVILDLQGSKWRLGDFQPFYLQAGDTVKLVHARQSNDPGSLPVPHGDFFQAAPVSTAQIVLSDARVRLEVKSIRQGEIVAKVILGGEISPRKGLTYSESDYRIEALSNKDRDIIAKTCDSSNIIYAISYVRDAAEMAKYRTLVGENARLIAKLERQTAIDHAGLISEIVDEVWLCRGDLGAELGDRSMAESVHAFTSAIGSISVPSLLAGQVLEHMTHHPTPTRSEVCFLHDALHNGFSGVVLSDETAIGRYPVESVEAAGMFR